MTLLSTSAISLISPLASISTGFCSCARGYIIGQPASRDSWRVRRTGHVDHATDAQQQTTLQAQAGKTARRTPGPICSSSRGAGIPSAGITDDPQAGIGGGIDQGLDKIVGCEPLLRVGLTEVKYRYVRYIGSRVSVKADHRPVPAASPSGRQGPPGRISTADKIPAQLLERGQT